MRIADKPQQVIESAGKAHTGGFSPTDRKRKSSLLSRVVNQEFLRSGCKREPGWRKWTSGCQGAVSEWGTIRTAVSVHSFSCDLQLC